MLNSDDSHITDPGNPALLSAEQVAAKLSISGRCVLNWYYEKIIPAAVHQGKVIRFREAEVMDAQETCGELEGVGKMEPQSTTRFPDAAAVARDVAARFRVLRDGTMGWVSSWNDSTLPQWLLDRTTLTKNTLQTTS